MHIFQIVGCSMLTCMGFVLSICTRVCVLFAKHRVVALWNDDQPDYMRSQQENSPSAPVPWGTEWIGKTSDMDGYYSNVQAPFYKSIRVTAQLPPNTKPFNVYTILRGVENVPVTVGGFQLPPRAVLRTHATDNVPMPSLAFIPIVNDTTNGSGLILYHSLAFAGTPAFQWVTVIAISQLLLAHHTCSTYPCGLDAMLREGRPLGCYFDPPLPLRGLCMNRNSAI